MSNIYYPGYDRVFDTSAPAESEPLCRPHTAGAKKRLNENCGESDAAVKSLRATSDHSQQAIKVASSEEFPSFYPLDDGSCWVDDLFLSTERSPDGEEQDITTPNSFAVQSTTHFLQGGDSTLGPRGGAVSASMAEHNEDALLGGFSPSDFNVSSSEAVPSNAPHAAIQTVAAAPCLIPRQHAAGAPQHSYDEQDPPETQSLHTSQIPQHNPLMQAQSAETKKYYTVVEGMRRSDEPM
jgi:hypothetical protein